MVITTVVIKSILTLNLKECSYLWYFHYLSWNYFIMMFFELFNIIIITATTITTIKYSIYFINIIANYLNNYIFNKFAVCW